ncbi:phage tail protein [Neptuniibacter sp.]|uniref:phage tail protein n=1 Tax=Neptuniibacter sp. TaxID=1962643 RepID=UPI00261752A2|nr:phage tail protein [Neptuniibacter sp.]MCP4597801.1 hypothetical protein [Neptuniibacter sp.]
MAWWVAALIVGATAYYSYTEAKKAQKKAKEASEAAAGVLITDESTNAAIPVIYGKRRVGGTRVYMTTSGDKRHKYLYMAIVLAEGMVEKISNIEIDNIPYTDDDNNVIQNNRWTNYYGEGDRHVYHETFVGNDSQAITSNGINIIKESMRTEAPEKDWAWIEVATQEQIDNFTLSGLAAICLRLEWHYDPAKNPFQGVPNITALVHGKRVYDPRKDSTNAAYDASLGVSNHRQTNVHSWEWSDNYALCLRDYMTAERYGKGLAGDVVDDVAIAQTATDLDSFKVTPYSGGPSNHQLFKCNAVVDTNEKIFDNIGEFLLNCRGYIPYINGSYSLFVDQASANQFDITPDHIVGGIRIVGPKKEDKFNQISVTFPDEATDYQTNSAVWPDPASDNPTSIANPAGGLYTEAELSQVWQDADGELLVDEVDLNMTTDIYQAKDMARIFALRSRDAVKVSLTCTAELMDVAPADVVTLTHPTPGWSAKPFQVENYTLNDEGTVALQLIEYNESIYTYDPAPEQIIPNPVITADPVEIESPSGLTLSTGITTLDDGTTVAYIDASFTAADDNSVSNYVIIDTPNGVPPAIHTVEPDTGVINARITGVISGEHTITVQAVSYSGFYSRAISDTITVQTAQVSQVVIQGQFQSMIGWTFDNADHGFTETNLTEALNPNFIALTATGLTPYWQSHNFNLSGASAPLIRAKVRRTAGAGWVGSITYKTSGHSFDPVNYVETIPDTTIVDQWVILEWDMSSLTEGGTDWADSTIEAIELRLGADVGDDFDIEWISIGRLGAATTQLTPGNLDALIADGTLSAAEYNVGAKLTGNGTFEVGASVTINVPDLANGCAVAVWWEIEQGYQGGTGWWSYQLKRDGNAIDSRPDYMVLETDQATGIHLDEEVTAGLKNYTFEWRGDSANISATCTLFISILPK